MPQPATLVARRARSQHGLITYRQALAAGATRSMLWRWKDNGWLNQPRPGVYRMAGAPETWEQVLLAAVLAGAGVASHRAAVRLWGLGEWDDVEVTVPQPRHPRLTGVSVHRSGDLAPRFVTRRQGIPVTNPMRTLVDLGAVLDAHLVSDALERAVIARVCGIVAVERALDDVAKRGRAGAGVIRDVLDQRALGRARPDGLLEARMARLLREFGLPEPRFHYRIGRLIVDFAYPDIRLVIEVDGHEVHGTPQALQADLSRQNVLVNRGWRVLRFTWLDVVQRPEWVAACIAEALRGRASA